MSNPLPPISHTPTRRADGNRNSCFDSLDLDRKGNGPYRLMRGIHDALVKRFLAAVQDPERAQDEVLGRILDGARGSLVGRELGLDQVRSLSDYRRHVPIADYNAHSAWILRAAAGERGVLSRWPVEQFLETSGTTGPAKWIPVTRPYAKGIADAQRLWVIGLLRQHEDLARGSALTLVSPAVKGHTPGGIPYGSNTGRMHLAQPWWVRFRYPIPYEVFCIPEAEPRIYTILRFALQADVRSITTANPTTILLLARKLMEYQDALARDLAGGSLRHGPAILLPAALRSRLERRLRRLPVPTDWRPASLWNLSLINCWTGGSAGFFLPLLAAALGADIPIREVGISASESFVGLSLADDWPGGVAWPLGELLEFVAEDDSVHGLGELEIGCTYRLVVSGTHGLYRYDLQDLVEVVGFFGRCPVLRFIRRAGNVLSVTGEKVTEQHLIQAMQTAVRVTGLPVVGFTARVQLAEIPFYEVAFEGESTERHMGPALEDALIQANVEYATKRETGRLLPLVATPLPSGTYARLRAMTTAGGTPDGQYKDPVLALSTTAWDRLLSAARDDACTMTHSASVASEGR